MSDSAEIKVKAETAQNGKLKGFLYFLRDWFFRNKIYFIAFLIPVAVMYAAYAIFKVYPFGNGSVLVLDLNGQYVYYFETLRDAFWSGDKSALYNWSRNLSGGFAGVIGYYLASPYTLIVMLLPRTMLLGSLLIMQLAKLGSAGVTFCYYLRKSKNLSEMQALIFSNLYALCAYGVIQLIDPMWLDGLILLPLIVLGIEYLVDDGRKLNFIIPLAIMMVANFYIGYMICIFTILYYIHYVLFFSNTLSKKNRLEEIWKSLLRIGGSAIVALACAAAMLLPVYNALNLGKFEFSEPDFSYATQFSPLDFFPQLLVAQYDTVNVEGHPEIYCGLLTLVMIPMFFLNKKIDVVKKWGYGLLGAILFICMYVRPIDMVWHGFQMPNWLPFRYSFTFSFIMLCAAAETLKNLKGVKLSAIFGAFAEILVFLLILKTRLTDGELEYIAKRDIWISMALITVYCIAIFVIRKFVKTGDDDADEESEEKDEKQNSPSKADRKANRKSGQKTAPVYMKVIKIAVPIAVIAVTCGELLYNCVDTLKAEDKDIIYSNHSGWYNFINNGRALTQTLYDYDDSFYRAEKTYHRTVNDTAAFGLRGISHSSSVMNAKLLKFIEAMGYSASTYYSRYDGGNPLTDSILGIKYAMDKNFKKNIGTKDYKRLVDTAYVPAFSYEYTDENDEDCLVDVYENPYALSMGYMVDQTAERIERYGTDNTFESQNILLSTFVGNTVISDTGEITDYTKYFTRLDVDPENFVLSNVTTSPYPDIEGNMQTMYTAGSGDPTVDMYITVPSEKPIYLYFKTENQKEVNLWLSEPDANGEYNDAEFVGQYFEGHNYHTVELGQFEPGTTIRLRMTVANEYTIVKDFFFYEFDEELFADSINKLKEQQWNLTKAGGRVIEGTITAQAGQMMMTSIPYEPGWTVRVDGKKTDAIEISEAMIGVKLEPGEHTVKMAYTPPGLIPGLFLFVLGVAASVMIYRYDKKNNKVLIEKYRAKNTNASQTNTNAKKQSTVSKKKKKK